MSYFEVHYKLPNVYDIQMICTYRGKKIRSYSTAEKVVQKLKADFPKADMIEIAEYDDNGGGRID